MELFQKIEQLTGQKMEKFEAEKDAALVLLDGVNEAQRIATMQVCIAALENPRGIRGGWSTGLDLIAEVRKGIAAK